MITFYRICALIMGVILLFVFIPEPIFEFLPIILITFGFTGHWLFTGK